MDKEFRRSLTTTFVILVVIIMLIATFCMGVGLTAKSTGAIGKVTNDYMLSVARSASGLIDGDELAGLDYGCEGSPSYLKIRDTLSCFNENTGLEDIYILRPESGVDFIFVMDLTDGDKAKGMPEPVIWPEYDKLTGGFEKLERFAFYKRSEKAYCVVQTGEERQYGNLILVKGAVL